MNLSAPDRFRLHFSTAVVGSGLSGVLGFWIPIPRLDAAWPRGSLIVYSIIGFLFGLVATSRLLEKVVMSLCLLTHRPKQACLRPAVNLLAIVAAIYAVTMPFVLVDLLKEVVWFALSGGLGAALFFVFLFRRHARRID